MAIEKDTNIKILSQLKTSKNVAMALHLSPDADSIGSNLALAKMLNNLGIATTIFSYNEPPLYLKDIVDVTQIIVIDPALVDYTPFDTFVLLDADNERRITNMVDFKIPERLKRINIDHHRSNNSQWALQGTLLDADEPSACTLLYKLFVANGLKISQEVATMLLIGILSDTGNMQFNTVKSSDIRMVADLMDLGANLYDIIYKQTFNEIEDSFRYKALIYNNLKLSADHKYAYSTITLKEREIAGITTDSSSLPGAADLIKRFKGVKFVFVISQSKDVANAYSISFRSHEPDFDVAVLAEALGGGGHKMAAAAKLFDMPNLETALAKVILRVESEQKKTSRA